MAYNKSIGIIGGTGTIGSIVVMDLIQIQTNHKILMGGRRTAEELSTFKLVNNKQLKYCQLDYNNEMELDHYCSQCFLVINVAGPSFKIRDKIALHALKNKCHYIDVGGYDTLYELLKPHEKNIETQKLCFIIGAGWMPGISGVFSKAIIERNLDNPEKTIFNIYYGAVDSWSYNSTYDLAAFSMGETRSYAYSYGEKIPVSPFQSTHLKYFSFIGHKKICMPSFDDQLAQLAISLKQVKRISTFVMVNDFVSMWKFMFLKVFYRNKLDKAARLLQDDYQRLVKKENKWGSVICQVSEMGQGQNAEKFYYLYTNNNLLYTALPVVIATQYLIEDKIKIGLNCLCDSLDCQSFMSDLENYGIKYSYDEKRN